jgi:methylthioribose-1-phosphate isomerase
MRTVDWDPDVPAVTMVDQRLLPEEYRRLTLRTPVEVAEAIRSMAVRGAPAIGAAAAFGLVLTARSSVAVRLEDLWADLERTASLLRAARPTAVNLGWALDRVLRAAHARLEDGPEAIRRAVEEAALRLADEDVEINRSIGRIGAGRIHDGDTVIHHCNTGALATVDYGTALGVIRTAHEMGKHVHVLVDETRPRLQGSRLTAWELQQYGIPFDIIADGAAGSFLRSGNVASVWVGADRVAANGDVANKIGTYMLALAAHDNQVPFYVAVPASSIDLTLASGEAIPIEERAEGEVLDLLAGGRAHSPLGSHARNPAFDVTPSRLVTAFITEHGALEPPFLESLQRLRLAPPPERAET